MKKYIIRIQCTNFEDIEVKAENKNEAKDLALKEFQCDGGGGEFVEFINKEDKKYE